MSIRIFFHVPNFFFIPTRQMTIENDPICNRTYFIHNDKIVAVGGHKGAWK